MRRPLVLLTTAAITTAAAVAVPALAATKTVKIGDNYFVRDSGTPTVTVKKNDTVKWKFQGDSPHNVTVTSGPSKFKSSNEEQRHVLQEGHEGRPVQDRLHDPRRPKMKLRVKSK